MHGSTIRLLEAAQFSTPQALAIAEAIDSGIQSAELVTVPVFEARMAQSETRFDAKLAQLELRLGEKMDERFAKWDGRFAQIDGRFVQIDGRFAQIDGRFAQIDGRFSKIDDKFAKIDDRFSKVDDRFSQIDEKFSVLFWRMVGLAVTGIGILVGISHFWPPAR